MIKKTITITNDRGMHFRPCCAFAELANKFDCSIFVDHRGQRYRGKTSMHLLSAWVPQGDEITIVCSGTDEADAMAALEALITSGFEEVLTNE